MVDSENPANILNESVLEPVIDDHNVVVHWVFLGR